MVYSHVWKKHEGSGTPTLVAAAVEPVVLETPLHPLRLPDVWPSPVYPSCFASQN